MGTIPHLPTEVGKGLRVKLDRGLSHDGAQTTMGTDPGEDPHMEDHPGMGPWEEDQMEGPRCWTTRRTTRKEHAGGHLGKTRTPDNGGRRGAEKNNDKKRGTPNPSPQGTPTANRGEVSTGPTTRPHPSLTGAKNEAPC